MYLVGETSDVIGNRTSARMLWFGALARDESERISLGTLRKTGYRIGIVLRSLTSYNLIVLWLMITACYSYGPVRHVWYSYKEHAHLVPKSMHRYWME